MQRRPPPIPQLLLSSWCGHDHRGRSAEPALPTPAGHNMLHEALELDFRIPIRTPTQMSADFPSEFWVGEPRPSYAPKKKSPAPEISFRGPPPTPSTLPRRFPQNLLQKSNSRFKISPPDVPQRPLMVRDPWGTFFGSVHFLTRARFMSRRMVWEVNP